MKIHTVIRVMLAMALASATYAADRQYTTSSGNWATDANWTSSSRPLTGDRAFIGGAYPSGGANATTVTLNTDESAQTISEIWVGGYTASGSGPGTLNVNSGADLVTNARMRIGGGVTGVVNQTGGRIYWSAGDLALGDSSGGANPGFYTISGGVLSNMATLYIGNGVAGTLTVNGGSVYVNGNMYAGYVNQGTVVQSDGTVTVSAGLRMGESSNEAATYNLSGGRLIVNGANSYVGIGGAGVFTFNQSGGTATFQTLDLGYSANGTYNLSGGQLNVSTLNKTAGSTFSFTGGTLTAGSVTFNLANAGGTVAPGTNNASGRTSITGTYSTTTGALAIKIGGTTAATVYQDTASKYANVTATGAITLGGSLKPSLINSFTPASGDTFTVVTGSSVSGTFDNTTTANGGGVRVALADGLSSFKVNYNATTVVLANYLADNEWQAGSGANWGAAGAASWTAMDPNGSGYVAKFGDAPSGSAPITANLDAARTVQGVLFTSANHQYTISGANTLTFDNTGNNAAAYITDTAAARTNTIGTAVALNSHLNVTTSVSDGLLTMSGPISGTGRVLTKLGPGTLRLSATNTYTGGTVINAGTLVVDGRILGDVNLTSSSARLGGHGVVAGNVTGSGTVTPGNSPGILTIGGLTPGSLTFNFEFTANDPDYTNPLNSLNDVLRITNATPFTANLTAANTVNLYLTTTLTPGITNVFRGGFYTDRNSPFNGEITNAIYNVFLNNVPYGAPLYVTTTNIPAFSQNGYVMEFGVLGGTVNLVPEPSVLLLLGVGGAVIWRRRRRKD